MTTSCVSIFSDYVITIWFSRLHVLISELNQSKSALYQRCSALKTQFFGTKEISAEQRWFRTDSLWNNTEFYSSERRWFRENQSWSALMFFMFSESALKKVSSLKQRWSALIISGTSARVRSPYCFGCRSYLTQLALRFPPTLFLIYSVDSYLIISRLLKLSCNMAEKMQIQNMLYAGGESRAHSPIQWIRVGKCSGN